MSGFLFGNKRYSVLGVSPEDVFGEPIFIASNEEGMGFVTLDWIRDAMDEVYRGDRDQEYVAKQFFIRLPGLARIEHCSLRIEESSGKPNLVVVLERTGGVAYTCEL